MSKPTAPLPATDALVHLADELRGLCAVITKTARRDHQRLLDRHGAGISALEHGVLRRLAGGADALADVSRLMGVAPSTLVYAIDRLVGAGLVAKKQDPRDRRRERLTLTAAGRARLAAVPPMDTDSALVRSLGAMSAGQRTTLAASLRTLAAGLDNAGDWAPELGRVPRRRTRATRIR